MPVTHRSSDLTRTLQHVKVPSAIVDREGVVTWLNEAGIQLLGDLSGRSFMSVVAPEDVPLASRQLERKLAGVRVTDYEIDVLTRDGVADEWRSAWYRSRVETAATPCSGSLWRTSRRSMLLRTLG